VTPSCETGQRQSERVVGRRVERDGVVGAVLKEIRGVVIHVHVRGEVEVIAPWIPEAGEALGIRIQASDQDPFHELVVQMSNMRIC